MEFTEPSQPTTNSNDAKHKLKMIGALVDMRLSVSKVDERQQLVLSEDGLLYRLEASKQQ